MDNYPLNRKKKHLLLLNRLLRQELKLVLIKTPSKLDDNKVNELFDKIFIKKDDYYVPKTNNEKLLVKEDLFKNLYKKKVKKSEPKKPEPKVEPKKPEPKENIKHKIIKGFILYDIDKNYSEAKKLYPLKSNVEFDFRENTKDITNDNILNWFKTNDEYKNFIENYPRNYEIYKYFKVLERIQDLSKELRNKLKNLKIIAVDESNVRKFSTKKGIPPETDLYEISFNELNINSGFEEEKGKKINYQDDEEMEKREKNRIISKELPSETQIYNILKNRKIDFDYFVYIFNRTYYTTHTGMPKSNFKGEGYEKDKEYLYDKNGKVVKIIRNKTTTKTQYSILDYLIKADEKKPEPKVEPKKPEPEPEPEPEEEDDKKQLIELNNKFLTEVDKIIKIKSPYTFQKYKDKNDKDSYFIKLLKEYEKDGTIKYNSKYDEIFKKLPYELWHKQQTEDFYPTPIACIKPFEDYIKQAEHILEPTAGLGHIVNKIREYNKDVKITAIEYTEDFSEILKILNPDVEVIKKNFLLYNPDKVDYDLIIINPPFTDGNDIRYYMNFLFQCLYLINRTKDIYMPTIIFISPSINDKNVKNEGFFLNDIVKSKMLSSKKLDEICKKYGLNPTKKQLEYLVKEDDNLFKKEEDLEEAQHFKHQFDDLFDFYQGDLIGQCEGFGGTSLKANLYRIAGYKRQKECNKVKL